jgi:outer membrane biogenesis lipoprotein LolB
MTRLLLIATLFLSACGVDGPPQRPAKKPFEQIARVTISGDARMGVSTEF